jgi:hypothetical protein
MCNTKGANVSEFYCTKCGKRGIPVLRTKGQNREPGHLKKLFCLTCGEVNHVEIKPFGKYTHDDFLLEFEGGNFGEDGTRILPYELFKQNLKKKSEKFYSESEATIESEEK